MNTYNHIEFKPTEFVSYLLSAEVGFATCTTIATPDNTHKGKRIYLIIYENICLFFIQGFQRSMFLFIKSSNDLDHWECKDELAMIFFLYTICVCVCVSVSFICSGFFFLPLFFVSTNYCCCAALSRFLDRLEKRLFVVLFENLCIYFTVIFSFPYMRSSA